MRAIDISGRRFGRLIVIKLLPVRNRHNQRVWRCTCDCGAVRNVVQGCLTEGNTQSCGCKRRQHGASHTRIYFVWRSMVSRCHQTSSRNFRLYGARGIKVCRRWRKFKNFLEDMGTPVKGLSLERINNDKGYSKKNCKWASRMEQCSNMRTNHLLTYKGRTLHVSGWARLHGIKVPTVFARLRRGLPLSRVLQVSL